MNELRFYQRPWFLLIFPPVLIIIIYFLTTPAGVDPNTRMLGIVRDMVFYVVFLLIWLAFFAQFVLPVQTFRDRQRIFDRLLAYLTGTHGPAIFVRNGDPVKGDHEEKKKGPGVLWLDSASGVVTREDAKFAHTFGPGVHFTDSKERVAGYVDLHIQTDRVGPWEGDKPFAKKTDDQADETYRFIQARHSETSGLTRDGIEVAPNININFKIDADPVGGHTQPGSRFGYEETAVFRAVAGEAVNPNLSKETHRYRVPWNQLPALLAADIWRDLLGSFTLNDLFDQKFLMPPTIPNPPPRISDDDPLINPIKPQSRLADILTGMLRELNRILVRGSEWIDKKCKPKREVQLETPPVKQKKENGTKEKKVTGLQVINFLLKERLQKQYTAVLDRYGKYIPGQELSSDEHGILHRRGIRVLHVNVGNLQLPDEVNKKLIDQWTANWLNRARAEQERLNQGEGYNTLQIEEEALSGYISQLSKDLVRQIGRNRANELRETLRALMLESRAVLTKESRQFRQGSPERDSLEEIIQWLETRDL
jgi:hypothetical protein